MKSVWQDGVIMPQFPTIDGDKSTDVLIIGGGMAGILCAYMLKNAGVDHILLEADRIASGITKNTTAKITSQHGLIYDKLIKKFGIEKASQYLKINEYAIRKYREICTSSDCEFEEKDAYAYSLCDREKLEREVIALEKLGFRSEFTESIPLPFKVAGAVKFEHQAQFDPLKFISAISAGLRIYERTAVKELVGTKAVTDFGSVKAKTIIVATHFPFINKHGSYFVKMYQHRSYVIAYENAPDVGGMYIDEADKGMSFRNYKNLLLIGGGDHRTGKTGGGWKELVDFAGRHYPQAKEKYRWATQDCMTLDGVPYIGRYSKRTDGMYVATGFNKWGMTSSMAAALILCDLVQGRNNPYAEVFSPSRTIMRLQLAANVANAAAGLLTPTAKRCPHLGCALKWNKNEHTWDCSCHGSRFTADGKVIDNPANGDMKKQL